MRRLVVALVVLAALAANAPPAAAKGPWRITVRGPGIAGEVDVMEAGYEIGPFAFAGDLIGRPRQPGPGAAAPFVVTWYSAGGWDGPLVDRLAVHLDTGAVEVLEAAGVFGADAPGWFETSAMARRALEDVIDQVVADRLGGPLGYLFVSSGDRAAWAPQRRPGVVGRLLAVLGGLAGLTSW